MVKYTLIKHIHIIAAVLSISLFLLRTGLDFGKRPQWRKTPLRWVPHVNDTLLLCAAIALVIIGSWNPAIFHWLAVKITLVFGYIIAGIFGAAPISFLYAFVLSPSYWPLCKWYLFSTWQSKNQPSSRLLKIVIFSGLLEQSFYGQVNSAWLALTSYPILRGLSP